MDESFSLNTDGWKKGLSEAQKSAAQFLAFMTGMNSKMESVANGSLDVANALASIGATSDAVKLALTELAGTGPAGVGKLQDALGSTGQSLLLQVDAILKGNAEQIVSFGVVGKEIDKVTASLIAQTQALKNLAISETRLKAQAATRAGPAVRAGLRDVAAESTTRRSRTEDPSLFGSTNAMYYEDPDKLVIARKMQRLDRMIKDNNLQARFSVPDIEHDESRKALNLPRLQFAYQQVSTEIKRLKALENQRSKEANANIKQETELVKLFNIAKKATADAEKKLRAEMEKTHQIAVRRELDQMHVRGPNTGRVRQLAAMGVISPLQRALPGVGGSVDRLFSKFEKGTAVATKGTMALVRGLQNAQSTMALMTSSFVGLVAMITGASLGSFFKMSMDFEKSMMRINALVKVGESDYATLTNQVKELSKAFGTMPMDTAEGFRIAISSDVPPQEIMQFMKEASKLAVTHSASVSKTADLLAMLRNSFNMTTKDMSRLRDMIFVMTDRGRTEVDQFASEIGKIAPTAQLAGVSVQEMMAAFAGLSRTRSTEQAGTLLRNLFKNIIEDSPNAATQLKKLELGITSSQVKANGLISTITNFREELKKNPKALGEVAEDLRELSAWGELTDTQFNALITTFQEMTDSVGLGNQKYNEMAESTAIKWDRLMAQMKISAMDMVQGMMGSFADLTRGANGVEIAQQEIALAFKRVELAVRYALGAFELFGGMVLLFVAPAVAAINTLYNGVKNIFRTLQTERDQNLAKDLMTQIEELDEVVQENAKAGDGYKNYFVFQQIDELKKQYDIVEARSAENAEKLSEDWKSIAEGWQSAFDVGFAKNPLWLMFKENSKAADIVAHDIADLNHVIKVMKGNLGAFNNVVGKTGSAVEALRDKTAALREVVTERLTQMAKLGKAALSQWLVDNRDMINSTIVSYRRLATEQTKAVKSMQRALKDLTKDQRAFDDSVQNRIEKIKDVDRTPKEKIDRLKGQGQEFERRANDAAKEGNRDEVQRLLQEAMGYYEDMLSISDTKDNRSTVVKALERLKGQMDEVYKTENSLLQQKLTAAEAAAKQFSASANEVEGKFKAFEQGVRDVTRAVEALGKAPSEDVLLELKDKIRGLMGDGDYFIKVAADPALEALDKMIDKAKEFNEELRKSFDLKLSAEETSALFSKTEGYVPVSEGNVSNSSVINRITNVDSVHVSGGPSGSEGAKKVDARRLAREIKRAIERGEAPRLDAREELKQYPWRKQ